MKKLFTLMAIGVSLLGNAQDFHLTQYNAAPLYYNPALTGSYFELDRMEDRIAFDYRSQWKSILPKAYNTCYLSYDRKIDEKWSAGGYIVNNRAVSGNYNSLSVFASGSYQITDYKKSPHQMSAGLQIGLLQLSYNNENFTYDAQYSANSDEGFDPGLPTGEPTQKSNLWRFDANLGFFYKYIDENSQWRPFGGLSVYHLTRPNESFTSVKNKMPMRFNFNAGTDYVINEDWTVMPSMLFSMQAKAKDILINALAKYALKENKNTTYHLVFGFNYRVKDAFAIQAGVIKGEQHSLILSYDINTSYLKQYTGGRGAFEISLILHGKRGENIIDSFRKF